MIQGRRPWREKGGVPLPLFCKLKSFSCSIAEIYKLKLACVNYFQQRINNEPMFTFTCYLILQTNNLRKFVQFVSYTETRAHQHLMVYLLYTKFWISHFRSHFQGLKTKHQFKIYNLQITMETYLQLIILILIGLN